MVTLVQTAWDAATFLVATGALYFVTRLFLSFRGGAYGKAYFYYISAASVLWVAFLLKVSLDFVNIQPEEYGISLRDFAVMIALILLALGLRQTKKFWTPSSTAPMKPVA